MLGTSDQPHLLHESSSQMWRLLLARAAGPPTRPCACPPLQGLRAGLWTEEWTAVLAGGTGPGSFPISRPFIQDHKVTFSQDLGSA